MLAGSWRRLRGRWGVILAILVAVNHVRLAMEDDRPFESDDDDDDVEEDEEEEEEEEEEEIPASSPDSVVPRRATSGMPMKELKLTPQKKSVAPSTPTRTKKEAPTTPTRSGWVP